MEDNKLVIIELATSPLTCYGARGSNIKVLIISMLPSTAIYNPPQTV